MPGSCSPQRPDVRPRGAHPRPTSAGRPSPRPCATVVSLSADLRRTGQRQGGDRRPGAVSSLGWRRLVRVSSSATPLDALTADNQAPPTWTSFKATTHRLPGRWASTLPGLTTARHMQDSLATPPHPGSAPSTATTSTPGIWPRLPGVTDRLAACPPGAAGGHRMTITETVPSVVTAPTTGDGVPARPRGVGAHRGPDMPAVRRL